MTRCDACDKNVYRTENDAWDAITRIAGFNFTGPTRVYPCPFNPGMWHLTSRRHAAPKHRRRRRPRIS